MKARHHARSIAALTALLAVSGAASVGAQTMRTPPGPNTPRLMVQVFASADKVAGPAATEELTNRLIRAFPSRILWIIDQAAVVGTLEQSGYSPSEQLPPSDEAVLAKNLRADEYIRGRVTKEGENYTVHAWMVLTRDAGLMQPLPPSTNTRVDRAAAGLVKSIQDARKQLDNEKQCMNLARDEKYDEAVRVADAGIADYPQATLVRYCKMNVLVRRKAPESDLLAMAREILEIDPNSKAALAVAADAEQKAGNTDAANDLLIRLLATNPSDAQLATRVVDALAASKKYDVAKEVVLRAVADNPGDIALISLQFRILTAAGDYKPAITTGEEMVQMDTSLADATFFQRLAAIYDADSQPAKAVEAAERATKKFPNDADLWQLYAGTLKKAGQMQASIAAARRALEVNPKIPNGWTQIAVAYNELGQPDSALAALREASAAGDDPNQVGQYALTIGNTLYKAAVAEDPKQASSFQRALPSLFFADSTIVDPGMKGNAKFLIGVSSYYVAQTIATGLQASKSCEDAKVAQDAATNSMTYTREGGRTSPEAAGQILTAVTGLVPYLDQSVKVYCKTP